VGGGKGLWSNQERHNPHIMLYYTSIVIRVNHNVTLRYFLSYWLMIDPSQLANDHLVIMALQQLCMYKRTTMRQPQVVLEWSWFN